MLTYTAYSIEAASFFGRAKIALDRLLSATHRWFGRYVKIKYDYGGRFALYATFRLPHYSVARSADPVAAIDDLIIAWLLSYTVVICFVTGVSRQSVSPR